jgi:hypothetical protein
VLLSVLLSVERDIWIEIYDCSSEVSVREKYPRKEKILVEKILVEAILIE